MTNTDKNNFNATIGNTVLPDVFIIAVVGMELFPQRMHIEKAFGEVLYKQLISILELIGKEVKSSEIPHYRLGVYLDSSNPGTRKFSLEEKEFDVICEHFGHSFHKSLSSYAKREQKKGTDVLFQLNNGNISMQEFADRLSENGR
ncbi:MAG: hypothetical protein ACRC0E_00330 [Soonwooa sp.]